MNITRRVALGSLLASPEWLHMASGATSAGRVLVVAPSAGGPHGVALEAMQRSLASHLIPEKTFQLPLDDSAFRRELTNPNNQLAIAVGLDALRALVSMKLQIPIQTTMSFRADLKNSGILETSDLRMAGGICLDLAVSKIIAGLRLVFPDANQIAVIRNPMQPEPVEAILPLQQQFPGMNVRLMDCASPSGLLAALRKLRGKTEFVICLPDSSLYNKTTVEPLILASLELRLPLVGYSSSFVRAGAAVGVYPDFSDVGRQTAEFAERYIAGSPATHDEPPRRTIVAVNDRVLRLLGREYHGKEHSEVVVLK